MDRQRIEGFLERFIGLAAGATTIGLLAVADRTGLLAHVAIGGGTAAEIAVGAELEERYVLEILSGLAAAGIIEYDPASSAFVMPPEHALFLAQDQSPYFMGGWLDMIPSAMTQLEGIARAVTHGGGVGFEEFGPSMIRGIDRGNSPSQRVFLVNRWLPAVPGLVERLNHGIRVADIGCGTGTVAILMAESYPNSVVTGFDVSEDSIAVAGERAGDLPNVEFHGYAVEEVPTTPPFDLITTFDVIHDLPHPVEALGRIRSALIEGGTYLMMEPAAEASLVDNFNPRGILTFGSSLLYCLPQSLVDDGMGLGAAWGPVRAEQLCRQVGFTRFELLPIDNPYSNFYRVEG
jgi:SAM-dependent methyltransferase